MPLSISNSNSTSFGKIFRNVFIIILALTICWEIFWRFMGFVPTHQDNLDLWNVRREQATQPSPHPIIILGSSRVSYGLNFYLMERVTQRPVIQLAVNGSAPLPLLEDLAKDKKIKGLIIIGVTPRYYFNFFKHYRQAQARVKYYHNTTFADKLSHLISFQLEKIFVYPSKEELGLQLNLYGILRWEKKHNGFVLPSGISRQFYFNDENRHTIMPQIVMVNKSIQSQLAKKLLNGMNPQAVITKSQQKQIQERTSQAIITLKERGSNVVFVRMPSSGKYLVKEKILWPRNKFWEPLIQKTGSIGIHFMDYPELSGFICPDQSHLNGDDAKKFTRSLISILYNKEILKRKK